MSDIKEKKGYGDINRYSILTRVGRGKYSNVFKGKIKNGSYCVIKVLKPVRNEKIKREINILQILDKCPNSTHLLDIVKDKDTNSIALILDWAENIPLRNVMRGMGTVHISNYIYKVLKALQFAHKNGIMHRDIKPGNIMFDYETLEVRVIDWGLADFYKKDTDYPVRVATRQYKGPELLLGFSKYDYSLDIWCLGCTFASLLFEKNPFFKGKDNNDQIVKLAELFGCKELYNYAEKYDLQIPKEIISRIQKYKTNNFDLLRQKAGLSKITDEAFDLLKKMLVIDHAYRISVEDALNHPYFSDLNNSQS